MNPKILILRIFNSNLEYERLMKDIHLQNEENNLFIVHSNDISTEWKYDELTRTLYIKGNETFIPGILNKTIKAIEICLSLFEFDVLVRSNISTVIDQKELTKVLETINDSYIYGGPPNIMNYIAEDAGVTVEVLRNIYGLQYISGTGIILSKNVCEYLISNKQLIDIRLIDDVAIGLLLRNFKMNIISPFISGPIYNPTTIFYRFKTVDRYNDVPDIKTQYNLMNL